MAKITLSSGVLRKGVRSTRAVAVLGQRASLFGVGRRGRAELAALNLKPASTGEDQMTANELKLYHGASPNSRRVRIFLAEKGLAVPLVPVDLGKGEHHGESYRAINPRRVVLTSSCWRTPRAIWRGPRRSGAISKRLIRRRTLLADLRRKTRRCSPCGNGAPQLWRVMFAAVMEGVNGIASERMKGRAIAKTVRLRSNSGASRAACRSFRAHRTST